MEKSNSILAQHLVAFLSGSIFAIGLLLSGMADPKKVLAFLDITGDWDPSLILVMVGAIPVAYLAFNYAKNKKSTFLGGDFSEIKKREVDKSLIIGSSLFGIGWGLSGICPGPAIVILGLNVINALIFFIALIAGMLIYELTLEKNQI